MICSYILTALIGFFIGGFISYASYKDKIRNYKKKLLATLDYYKINSQDSTNILIIDFESDE